MPIKPPVEQHLLTTEIVLYVCAILESLYSVSPEIRKYAIELIQHHSEIGTVLSKLVKEFKNESL